MYFEKLTRKRDTLIQSIRMSESQPEIFNEVSNSRLVFLIKEIEIIFFEERAMKVKNKVAFMV